MSIKNFFTLIPIERWIRLIAGSQASAYSLLTIVHHPYWAFPLIILGWTLLLSFIINCSPLMIIFWSLGINDQRPIGAREPWIFGKGTTLYIERWTRLLAGLAYFFGGSFTYFHVDYLQAPYSYWAIVTGLIGFVQMQGTFSNWCPSLVFMKWIGVKDENSLNNK
jgi:hypothetical protein